MYSPCLRASNPARWADCGMGNNLSHVRGRRILVTGKINESTRNSFEAGDTVRVDSPSMGTRSHRQTPSLSPWLCGAHPFFLLHIDVRLRCVN